MNQAVNPAPSPDKHKTTAPTPKRVRRAQVISLTLLVMTGVINYLDRGTLAVANKSISTELGLSLGQMGLLLSAFSWSYAIAQLPAGGLVDRIGPRKLCTASSSSDLLRRDSTFCRLRCCASW